MKTEVSVPESGRMVSEKQANPGRPEGEEGKAILKRMNVSHEMLRRFAFSCVSWPEHLHILDIGCGGGAAIRELLEIAPDSVVEGIDYSQESVRQTAEYNADEIGKRVFVRLGDVSNLPYESGSFDVVTAIETVYFWPDVPMAIRGIRRILKKGGRLMIICEGSDPDDSLGWPHVDGTFRIYRPEELEKFIHQAGFSRAETFHGESQHICVVGTR